MVATHNGVCVEGGDPYDSDFGSTQLVRWTSGFWKCTDYQHPDKDDDLPDLRSSATLGGLLQLVREAHGDDCIHVYSMDPTRWQVVMGYGYLEHGGDWIFCSEAEALVCALEAAHNSALAEPASSSTSEAGR